MPDLRRLDHYTQLPLDALEPLRQNRSKSRYDGPLYTLIQSKHRENSSD